MASLDDEVYLVFKPSDEAYMPWLKKGFEHVLLIRYDEKRGFYLEVEPKSSRLETCNYSFDLIGFYKEKGYRVLKVQYIVSDKRYLPFFSMFTCVNMVKYCMNYKCWCLTPYQLYKHFKRGVYKKRNSRIKSVMEV